jgi:hypothetical protein
MMNLALAKGVADARILAVVMPAGRRRPKKPRPNTAAHRRPSARYGANPNQENFIAARQVRIYVVIEGNFNDCYADPSVLRIMQDSPGCSHVHHLTSSGINWAASL